MGWLGLWVCMCVYVCFMLFYITLCLCYVYYILMFMLCSVCHDMYVCMVWYVVHVCIIVCIIYILYYVYIIRVYVCVCVCIYIASRHQNLSILFLWELVTILSIFLLANTKGDETHCSNCVIRERKMKGQYDTAQLDSFTMQARIHTCTRTHIHTYNINTYIHQKLFTHFY